MMSVDGSYAAKKAEYGDSFVYYIITQLPSFWDTNALSYLRHTCLQIEIFMTHLLSRQVLNQASSSQILPSLLW